MQWNRGEPGSRSPAIALLFRDLFCISARRYRHYIFALSSVSCNNLKRKTHKSFYFFAEPAQQLNNISAIISSTIELVRYLMELYSLHDDHGNSRYFVYYKKIQYMGTRQILNPWNVLSVRFLSKKKATIYRQNRRRGSAWKLK